MFSGQPDTLKSKRLKIFENYLGANKDEILMRLFTCGNNLVSGEYGFLFDKKIPPQRAASRSYQPRRAVMGNSIPVSIQLQFSIRHAEKSSELAH